VTNFSPRFRATFWGVRGSHPTAGRGTLRFGGHTSCVAIEAGEHQLIFDAGTGIIALGKKLLGETRSPLTLNLFLSHTHHDHIAGFYFFEPLFRRRNHIFIFGPNSPRSSLRQTLQSAMDPRFFPVDLRNLVARKKTYSLAGGEYIRLRDSSRSPKVGSARGWKNGAVSVLTHRSLAHPNGVLLYRVWYHNRSVVYATDIEQRKRGNTDVIDFVRDTDVLIHDAQYLESEYSSRTSPRTGWGHSTVERVAAVARAASVKRLILFHHDPAHDDNRMREIEQRARRLFPPSRAAYEGMSIDLLRD
jgi:phosphoribosyl 1,2-cyclic phosphodiesterase